MQKIMSIRHMRKHVAARTGLKKEDAEIAIRTVFDVVKQLMYEGYEVRIPNFAIFFLNKLKGGPIRIPDTERIVFKENRWTPRCRFSSNFKKQVKRKKCTQV